MSIRLTHATSLILHALASGYRHGFQMMDASGLPSGTVYPALRRLERAGYVTSEWEPDHEARAAGRPRRRVYALTASGEALAGRASDRLADARRLLVGDPAVRPSGPSGS